MRRTSLAVLVLTLAAASVVAVQLRAQQDPLIVSARQFAQQGNHDTAINMLRGALAGRPSDTALKQALLDVLELKQRDLSRQLSELRSEIAALRGVEARASGRISAGPPAAPVRVGGHIGTPMKVHDVKPVYPPLAQEARVQGIVILEAMIDTAGNVTDAKVLRGQPLLNDAAIDAVLQWKYRPTMLNGVPVPVIMTVTVTFTLQD